MFKGCASDPNCSEFIPSGSKRSDEKDNDSIFPKIDSKIISNSITGLGGTGQIGAGYVACSTGLGGLIGAPLIVLGVSNAGESLTGFLHRRGEGFNLTQEAIKVQFRMTEKEAAATNAIINLTADLLGLNLLTLPKSMRTLSPRYSTDFKAVKHDLGNSGLVLNMVGVVNSTNNVLTKEK
ncbi:hypothetical protein Q4489_13510 [Thalassotalea sp. 1_MG-2023]|uniref:hypothetical protein n=1 Tax=Thalassotalea sp. 1_MG-2023 TaxID=3062680 RepID=UPI0026E37D31|nr:hypothetical protein [Thalassotalea sp. 1_MG-2023]MDO6428032.1 hypothetical protein [Thalassotalea sp. 1_MG-2023]